MCPNINDKKVRNDFNKIVQAFGGQPMTIDEFRYKELRNERSGVDDLAMQHAYTVWSKTNGEPNLDVPDILNYSRFIITGDIRYKAEYQKNINNEAGILPINANKELYKELNLLNDDGNILTFPYTKFPDNTKGEAKFIEEVFNKKSSRNDIQGKYSLSFKKSPNGKGRVIWITKLVEPEGMQEEIDFDTPAYTTQERLSDLTEADEIIVSSEDENAETTDSKAISDTQNNEEKLTYISAQKVSKNVSKRQIKAIVRIADDLSRRFGVKFNIMNRNDSMFYEIAKTMNTGAYYRRGGAVFFYDLIKPSYVIHEMFGHPMMFALRTSSDPIHRDVYSLLLKEALLNEEIVQAVDNSYEDSEKTIRVYDGDVRNDEIIIRSIEKEYENRQNNKIAYLWSKALRLLTETIKRIFGNNSIPTDINPYISIGDMLDYVLYGKNAIDILSLEDKDLMAKSVDAMTKEIKGINGINIAIAEFINIFKGDTSKQRAIEHGISEYSIKKENDCLYILKSFSHEMYKMSLTRDIIIENESEGVRFEFKKVDGIYQFPTDDSIHKLKNSHVIAFLRAATQLGDGAITIKSNRPEFIATIMRFTPTVLVSKIDEGTVVVFPAKKRADIGPDSFNISYRMLDSEMVTSDELSKSTAMATMNRVLSGLKSKLHTAERSKTVTQSYLDSLKLLIKDVEKHEALVGMIKFIEFSANEIRDVKTKLDSMVVLKNTGKWLDDEQLFDISKNFLSMYDSATAAISTIVNDSPSIAKGFPKEDIDSLIATVKKIRSEIDDIKSMLISLNEYQYVNTIKREGLNYRSTTVTGITKKSSDTSEQTVFSESDDIGQLTMLVGAMVMSPKEQHRILFAKVEEAKMNARRAMEADGVILGLKEKWDAVRAKRKYATFSRYMEKDDKGRTTGYLLSDLKYGSFYKNYDIFMNDLNYRYGLTGHGALPTDEKEAAEFQKEKNAWMEANVERIFTPEYYKLREKIRPSTQELMTEYDDILRSFYSKFRDENGIIRTERMTLADKESLFDIKKRKEALSMLTYADGTPKTVGSYDYTVAIELQEFYKATTDGIKYKFNVAAFELAKENARKTLTAAEFKEWMKENTTVRLKDEFYDMISSSANEMQSEKWKELYQIRKDLLKYNRDMNTMEVIGTRIEANAKIAEMIKRIDKKLSDTRVKTTSTAKFRFKDIAEVVPNQAYNSEVERLSLDKSSAGVIKLNEFKKNSGYYNKKGKFTLYSHWSKIVPKNKSYIEISPNFIWQELDESSPLYNKDYDKSKEKYGMQPKRSMYDNSKEYNKLASNKEDKEFLEAYRGAMQKANENYFYMNRSNPNRLPQISTSFFAKVVRGSNWISGFIKALKDSMSYMPEDLFIGDSDSSGKYYADGTAVKHIPTRYRTMLEDTNMISRDLLGSFAMYYSSSLNFVEMSKVRGTVETILEGLRNVQIHDPKGKEVKTGGRMYQKAAEFVNSEVYGDDKIGTLEFSISRGNIATSLYNMLRRLFNKEKVTSGRIGSVSVDKFIKAIISYTRIVNLGYNIKSIFSNFGGAKVQQKIEASMGSFFTEKGLMFANREIALVLPSIVASSTNRSNDKVTSLMRYFGVTRSNESDMKNLHGWKFARYIEDKFWYGPYEAGDFAIKAPSMIAILDNFRLHEGEFYSREQFLTRFYPGASRKEGAKEWDSIRDTLYSAYSISDNTLVIDPKYAEFITPELENQVSLLAASMSRKLDGSLTGTERTAAHRNLVGSMMLLHKNYLLWAIQDRFHPKMYRYDLGVETSGIYKGENMKVAPKIWMDMLFMKMSKINEKYEYSQRYSAQRLAKEFTFFIALSAAATIFSKYAIGDDDDKIKESWEMLIYLLMARVTLEVGAMMSPSDVYNLQKEPFGTIGMITQGREILDMVGDGSYGDIVRTGHYEGFRKIDKSLLKIVPIAKQYQPYIGNPNFKKDDAFLNASMFIPYSRVRDFIWPENWNARAREKSKQLLQKKQDREQMLKDAGIDMEEIKRMKKNSEHIRDSIKKEYGY